MPRPRDPRASAPPTVVLDSEALSTLANPAERGATARRAQAVLEAVERGAGFAVVPAPVLAEVSRGRARSDAIARVLVRLPVIPTDRAVAERAGALLERDHLDSCHAVDAFVVATAIALGRTVVLTGDPQDLARLSVGFDGVVIQGLR